MTAPALVELHVDPSCPFAWVAWRWLSEVATQIDIRFTTHVLSLSVVNEHREIDDAYREFNNKAWGPARVMCAVALQHGETAATDFYREYGLQFHVALRTADDADRNALAAEALKRAGLPVTLADASTTTALDDELRARTHATLARVGLDVGVPLIAIDGTIASGPVLSRTPTGAEAVALFEATRVLLSTEGLVRIERHREGELVRT